MNATTVTFTNPNLVQRAQHKAHTLGLSLSAYVSHLVEQDTHPTRQPQAPFSRVDNWGPVPAPVAKRWDEEERQFEEEEKQGKHPGLQTVEALMQDLKA